MNKFQELFSKLNTSQALFITSDINRRYFSNMKSSAGYILAFPEKAYLLIDFRYIEKAQKTVKSCEVILLTNLKEQVRELMQKHNANTMFIESDTVTISQLNSFKKIFEDFEIDASSALSDAITQLRCVKSDSEIEKIEKAQRIAEKAFEHILEYIKVGVTEQDIALELNNFMLKNGAEDISFDTIALAGENTSLPHGVPSQNKVKYGDFVLMDYGAVFEGYHSDMTRTICVGTPTEKMREIYDLVLEAQIKALNCVKADIQGDIIDKAARDIISNAGYDKYFGHGLGHGVGMEVHEYPNASPSFKKPIPKNSILTIEPGVYIPNEFGVRIEDFVVVTENGAKNLTLAQKNLICLK